MKDKGGGENFSFSLFLKRKERIASLTQLEYLINFARSLKSFVFCFLEKKKNLPYSFQISPPFNFRLEGGEDWMG